jgi:hypothetical protein
MWQPLKESHSSGDNAIKNHYKCDSEDILINVTYTLSPSICSRTNFQQKNGEHN